MKEEERNVWQRYEEARSKLILYYLPLVDFWVEKISSKTFWANKDDLKQEAIKGIIKAIEKHDSSVGVEFDAQSFIRRAIFSSPELTRNIIQYPYKNYRKVIKAHDRLMKKLERKITIEEIAQEAELTVKQTEKALDAISIGFAAGLPDFVFEKPTDIAERQDTKIIIDQALAHLSQEEALIVADYYFGGLSDIEIAKKLGKKTDAAKKTRQRALKKMRKFLEAKPPQEDRTTRNG